MYHAKKYMPDGSFKEIKIWAVPRAADKPHGVKYSFVYIVGNDRVVGYDNAEGKGDHRHIYDVEYPYRYESIEKLWADFHADMERYRKERR